MHLCEQPLVLACPELGRRVRGYGGRREPIHRGSCETSMFRKAPVPPPPSTLDGVLVAMEDQRQCRSFPCVTGRWCDPCVRSGTEPTSAPRRDTPCVSDSRIRRRPSVGGGRRVATGGTVKNMDVFAKPLAAGPGPGGRFTACPGAWLPDGRPLPVRTERLLLRAKYPPATPHHASLPARRSLARSMHPSSAARATRVDAVARIPCRGRGTATTSPPASARRRAGRRW
jgi:hypothetical protein